MKKIALTVSFIFFVFLMYGATFSQAANTVAEKIVEASRCVTKTDE